MLIYSLFSQEKHVKKYKNQILFLPAEHNLLYLHDHNRKLHILLEIFLSSEGK